jgi:hypothetical protein
MNPPPLLSGFGFRELRSVVSRAHPPSGFSFALDRQFSWLTLDTTRLRLSIGWTTGHGRTAEVSEHLEVRMYLPKPHGAQYGTPFHQHGFQLGRSM